MLTCVITEHETGAAVCTVFADPTPDGFVWKYVGTADDVDGIPTGITIAEAKDLLKRCLPNGKYNYDWAEAKGTGRKRGRPSKGVKMKDFHLPLPQSVYEEMSLEAQVRGMRTTTFARNCLMEFLRPGTFPRLDLFPINKKEL